MPHTRRGQELEDPVEDAVARAKDRHRDELLAGEDGRVHLHHRRLDALHLELEVAGDLVAHQDADLFEELPEGARGGVLTPHQGELVLHQRVVDHVDFTHRLLLS